MKNLLFAPLLLLCSSLIAQVDTSFIYNTNMPYGTLDIRTAKSATRYYYLQEDRTISFRESSPGVRTNTFRDMTSWDSSPYTEGNLREKINSSDVFIMNYRLLFPQGYQNAYADGYPLIVMMHGAGERANCWDNSCYWADRTWRPSSNNPAAPTDTDHELLNNDHNLSHGGKQHLDARNLAGTRLPGDPTLPNRAFPGFVLFAQNLNGWDVPSTHDLIRLVRLVVRKYNIDPNRIYIHGLSNGGIATYNVIKRAPWLFAAALPMSAPTDAGITSAGLEARMAHIPLWIFQGGKDVAPTPVRTEGYVRKFREAGASVRYSLYENLGHGTWNTAYGEQEFFSWMRAQSKRNIHVFYGNTSVCGTSGEGVKLGLADGFFAYQWEKDGVIISGANSHELVATQPGVYRARFSRISAQPGSGQWEKWSPPVTITGDVSAKPSIVPVTTTHLRGPDNAGPNTIELRASVKAEKYFWFKNGTLINIPNNSKDDTVSRYSITATSTGYNGAYTLKTGTINGCESVSSNAVNLFFNNSAPYLADANTPGSLRLVSVTGSTATLAWDDRSSSELAFEIWRRAPGGTFILAGRTFANAESFTDRGLLPATAYEYKIRAVNNQGRTHYAPGDALATNLHVTTGNDTSAPTAPKNLKVTRNTTSSISLAWTASTDNNGQIKHYVIYYGSASVATASAETSYTITGLPANTTYNITVKAVDNAGLFSAPSNQVSGSTTVTGLWYAHSTGAWTDLDQITNWDDPEFTGWVPNFTLAPRTQEEYFNFEFTGYLYVKTGGTYYFYLNSDEGSRIYIDGNQVLDFDGIHGRSSANSGFGPQSAGITLTAGAHRLRVIFFEYTGSQSLSVAYRGADTGNTAVLIPDEALTSGAPSSQPVACAGTGKIQQEVWTGISGTMISSIPVNSDPSSTTDLTTFEGPANIGDNYGRRIRGYVCVPASGSYIFWISSNDKSELWLSTDENPANKRRISWVDQYTNVRQWDKYTTQKSASISLVAGHRYYIEALQKEGVGTDHIAVGWQLPGGSLERPIPGNRLVPFGSSGAASSPVVNITSPEEGENFIAPASVTLTADASVSEGSISKVEFYRGTTKLGEDSAAPYSLAWNNVDAGTYSLSAKAIASNGTSTTSASVSVTVSGTSSCVASGAILRELWTNVQYNNVASIPVNEAPDDVSELLVFEEPSNSGDNYGSRVSGYLCVPVNGAYTFWIASNDHSELWLSTDDNPENRQRIAWVTGYTSERQWTKYASQQSAPVTLTAGQRYYIEALHKEGVGSDHMAVGWQLPDGTLERPMPGSRLSPFERQGIAATAFGTEALTLDAASSETGEEEARVSGDGAQPRIFPNPAPAGTPTLTLSAYGNNFSNATVEIVRLTGERVFAQEISCGENCRDQALTLTDHLEAGVYLVNVKAGDRRYTQRLMIR